jgi:hypothetical protein
MEEEEEFIKWGGQGPPRAVETMMMMMTNL